MHTPRSPRRASAGGGGLPVTSPPERGGANTTNNNTNNNKVNRRRLFVIFLLTALALLGVLSGGLGGAPESAPSVRQAPRTSRRALMKADDASDNNAKPPAFLPGQPWFDTDGNFIQAHGGSALRTPDGTYWWYGEDKSGASYETAPGGHWRVDTVGVAAYWSRDLIHWHRAPKLALAAIPGHADLDPKTSILERPKVVYNAKTKKYVMWMHIDSIDYHAAKLGVAVSDSGPAGPFKFLRALRPNDGQESRDMTIFVDEKGYKSKDGKKTTGKGDAYVAYSSEINKVLHISRLTPDYLDVAPISKTNNYTRVMVGLSREAPAMFQAHGAYFLITSGCTGWDPNSAEVFVADHPLSSNWTSLGAPMSGSSPEAREKTFYSQPAFVVPAPGGPEGAFIYMGDQWNKEDLANSRYVWLPLWVFPPEKGAVDAATGRPVTSVPLPRPSSSSAAAGNKDGASAAAAAAALSTSAVVSTASVPEPGERKENSGNNKDEKTSNNGDAAKTAEEDAKKAKAAAAERATALAAAQQHGAPHAVVLQWADSWHPDDLSKGAPPKRPKVEKGRIVDVDS